jgi:asparagine synthase (glutamine-hydrolysing)
MCGIAGLLDRKRNRSAAGLQDLAGQMAATLKHRGPDDAGVWVDATVGIGLGHRRLSVIDLSAEGHQPMLSLSGRYVISFNGEIYNFREIRAELEPLGHRFRGHSDTEVVLAAVEQWGLAEALRRSVGMFAFALWDRTEKVLHLARDRLGEKPLYYGWTNGAFVFASELKALRAFPDWKGEIDRNALTLFIRHNYVPGPYSIYKGIYKLTPGTLLTVSGESINQSPKPVPYWSAKQVTEKDSQATIPHNLEDPAEQLDRLLRDAVLQKMVADVPLGAFLSGGVDSSTVVALMQAQSGRPVKTFTIGFHESEYNEAEQAKAVARHLGTDHTQLYVTPREAMDVIPSLPALYDEPFADSSQIPTYLVSRLARQHVTVSLSGDGGDELFAGYNRYFLGRSIWKRIRWVPRSVRKLGSHAIVALSPKTWNGMSGRLNFLLPRGARVSNPSDKSHKLAAILAVRDPEAMYRGLVSHWENPETVVLGGSEPATVLTDRGHWAQLSDFTERMMYLDLVTYLPDDILVKVDRASMAVSLEARVPLLDHRVVEFAWRLPLSLKIRKGQGKWLLRQVLYKYVPRELIERPKMGFGVPIDHWLRGPLRNWAEALLAEDRLKREGYFNPHPIRQKWLEHLSGERNWQYHLWDILMFQAWLEAQ